MTGLKKCVATRALLSVPLGRGCLTRFQRCCRYGAARRLDLVAQQRGTGTPDVLAGGTTSRSCRRTPRVSPLLQFGATLQSIPVGPLRARRTPPRRGTANFVPGALAFANGYL